MLDKPIWERDGLDWPNRESSFFADVDGLRWHVQRMGAGPTLLLVHGTGAATHSWRDLAPILAESFTVVAPDLPGHGFTATPGVEQLSLPGMARALGRLLDAIDCKPELAVGHSAGAAVLARMAMDGAISPQVLVSLNGALVALRGFPGRIFLPVARMMAGSPFVAWLVARRASDPRLLSRALESTGSRLDAQGIALYGRLMSSPGHTGAVLSMMAHWDLVSFERQLPTLPVPMVLVAATADGTVPPHFARRAKSMLKRASLVELPDLGHLAHEEDPQQVADLLMDVARSHGVALVAEAGFTQALQR
ncbi:MAG: alpha/beta fold hydrolase BchO [Rhodocyclaceae bacterium]